MGACLATLLVALVLVAAAAAAEPIGVKANEPAASEQAPKAPAAEPVVEEPTTPTPTEPVTEEAPPPPPAEPIVEEPAAPPPSEAVGEEAPTPPATEPVLEAPAPPAEPIVEEPAAPAPSEAVGEEVPTPPAAELVEEETPTRTASPVAVDPHGPPSPIEGEGEVEDGDPPEVPSAPIASPAIAAQGALPVASSTTAADRSSLGEPAGTLDSQPAENLNCALSGGLRGFAGGSCDAAWFDSQIFLSPSPDGLAGATAASQASTDATDDGDHGRSTADFHPAGQTPGPSPGGASGGSAVGGSAGCSSCLTLAGLLRLSGPRAMLRLRLSCEPWLTACFVLIPERPG